MVLMCAPRSGIRLLSLLFSASDSQTGVRSSLCIAPVQWWQVVAAIFNKIENGDDRVQVEGQIDTHLIIDWVPCS